MKLTRVSALVAALVVGSTAMSYAPAAPENLFPTSMGSNWVIRTIVPGQDAPIVADITVTSEKKVGDTTTAVFQYKANGAVVQEETYIVTPDQVSRKRSGQGGSSVLEPPIPIIKYPMALGKSWKYSGKITIQAPTGEMELDSTADLKVAAFEEVKTGAGTFKAYRVDMKATISSGATNQEVTNSYWFAAGVGMVKQSAVLPGVGGDITGTLTSYKIK